MKPEEIINGIARNEVRNSMNAIIDVIKRELTRLGLDDRRAQVEEMCVAVRSGSIPVSFEQSAINSVVIPKIMAMELTPANATKAAPKKTAVKKSVQNLSTGE